MIFIRSKKEQYDLDIFDDGVKSISDFGKDVLMPHFIYCGDHYISQDAYIDRKKKLNEILLTKMRKFGIQSSILTLLRMRREGLVTKERAKKAAEGKLWKNRGSINDDLDRFFSHLQNQTEVKKESVSSFFTPKLTNEELRLVREGNREHLSSYQKSFNSVNPDVSAEEMQQSNSKSKYVHAECWRHTYPLILETNQFEDEDETEDKTEIATEIDGQNKVGDICFEAPQIQLSST